jgi:DNA processing protein
MIATGIPISTGLAYLHALGFTQAMLRYVRESGSITGYTSQDIERYLKLIQSMTAVRSSTIENIRDRARSITIESIVEYAEFTQTRYVIRGDHDYPLGLATSPMSPEILYVRWSLRPELLAIAVVGTREASAYGVSAVKLMVPGLVGRGVSIISGGALGIDTEAHAAALAAGGHTVAVLGSGLDQLYPRANLALFGQIIEAGGALVSEFTPSTEAAPYTFPIRNQTIALWARWTLVIEARERSGSLITARAAIEWGRDIFAIPGDIGRWNSHGTNALIRSLAAKLVMTPEDILCEYALEIGVVGWMNTPIGSTKPQISRVFDTPAEEQIYIFLQSGPKTLEELARLTTLSPRMLSVTLSTFEINGVVSQPSFWLYSAN